MKKFALFLLGWLLVSWTVAQEPVDMEMVTVIKKHGLQKSQVMNVAGWLTDVYGPRLTGSPMLDKATAWAQETLNEWGMENVHLESWGPFGRGWTLKNFQMAAVEPSYWPVIGYPKAWSPSTGGTDHLAFDAAGIPGFQFIRDAMAYFTRTHLSKIDNYDHLSGEDLPQAATIIASFVWHTAQRDKLLPRKALDLEKP